MRQSGLAVLGVPTADDVAPDKWTDQVANRRPAGSPGGVHVAVTRGDNVLEDGPMREPTIVAGLSGRSHPCRRFVAAIGLLAASCAGNDYYQGPGSMAERAKDTPNQTVPAPSPPPGSMMEVARHMPSETVYMGRSIHLSATQTPNGNWTGTAWLSDEPDRALLANGEFATADEAKNAALSRAMSEIDQQRRFRGKP
jgi:hypothetical protein